MILALTSVSLSSMIANTQRENDQNTTSCLGRKHVESRSFPFTCSLSLLFSSLRVYLIVNCSTDAMS
ncbi:hypothetical protein HBI56_022340 [Parastagonospora nodorum]|uniref:Uncharacterized protein n=1 Tax=Phaeosphaeria nodorum (strain SN15 / ATCC MYA-4574 / FGSC 10173) TaxID=321614 RepID=A0A7U2F566_PHANO|nr:hypothetical protein HBH56_026200 [Parastagonospora nodorum]QRC98934.1 hypothetical protein JI435_412810 [Parastagonospora nodorum SN15]KAH3934355.1 hypothetical protein HBH54_055830 [Parastagonospora nodorum]KAH3949788.1 hypothetical protein HBH53_083530 [Parastagonospora nodorum]KAH4006342.1 hypothetical protein HBI10_026840 [Parastagonospora nodorum]